MKRLDIDNSGRDSFAPRFDLPKIPSFGVTRVKNGLLRFNTPIQPTYTDKPSADEMKYDDKFSRKPLAMINNKDTMNKKSILKKYTGKGGPKMGVSDFQRMQRQDDQKIRLDASKAPSPFSVIGSGLKSIGRMAMKPVDYVISKQKRVNDFKEAQGDKYIIDNFGTKDNYANLQKMPLLKKKLGK